MPFGIARGNFTFAPIDEIPYAGTDVSADLLWHAKKIDGTNGDVTTANGYESNGINVAGTTYNANFIKYTGNQTFGSGNIGASGDKIALVRVEGNLTISASYTLTTSGTCNALCLYVAGNLTVNGSISMNNKGRYISGGVSTDVTVNSNTNSVAGGNTIAMTDAAGNITNGSSTASTMSSGGGGKGGYGSYGSGNGNTGHIFSGGSGGGGGGGIAYPEHYSGGGGGGGTATAYAGTGGGGGASGHTKWGYWTADAGGTGGTGNGGGGGGTNNSYNGSDSRAGYSGHTGTGGSLIIYAEGDLTVASGGSLYTTGRSGQTGGTSRLSAGGGGGSGGGILVAVCGGTFTNSGTVSAAGGSTGSGRGSGATAGSGGVLTGGGYA